MPKQVDNQLEQAAQHYDDKGRPGVLSQMLESDLTDVADAWGDVLDEEDEANAEVDEQQHAGDNKEVDESDDGVDESDDEKDGEDGEEPEEELDEDGYDLNQTLKVKVAGEEHEVTLKELKEGFSRTQDYTRKTTEIAQERAKIQEQERVVLQQQAQWADNLTKLSQRLQAGLSGRSEQEWERLRSEDEYTYYRERDRERSVQDRLSAIEQEQQRVAQEHQEFQQKQLEQWAKDEQDKLLNVVPEWKDRSKAQEDVSLIKRYGQDVGITEQEIDSLIDHRFFVVLRDAAKFRALQKKTKGDKGESGKEKVRLKKSSGKKTLKSGARRNDATGSTRLKKADQRLRKTHTVQAAADAFTELLNQEE